jgi:hypothetical protein
MHDESKFKTLRHIETVRNYLNACIHELLSRAEKHDQSKLAPPEVDEYDKVTAKLRGVTFNSPEYKQFLIELEPILKHHYRENRHHPEHFKNGISDMNLIDLLEMLCDWKSSSLRHNDGNILKSIQVQQERFKYSDELKQILENTAKWLDTKSVFNKAEES